MQRIRIPCLRSFAPARFSRWTSLNLKLEIVANFREEETYIFNAQGNMFFQFLR